MKTEEHQKILLKDYQVPDFSIQEVELFFDLHEDFCRVRSRLTMARTQPSSAVLVLDGVQLELEKVVLNGQVLSESDYTVTKSSLSFANLPVAPHTFQLEIAVKIQPAENTALEGLYKSGQTFLTQCEAQGFRRITYFLDRPDVMSLYTVHIEAEQKKYPVLLANGNRVQQKILPKGRHQVTWHDPHRKPCYLFALVAGDLGLLQDEFTTTSGQKVNLEIYALQGQQQRCTHAMQCLKKSMRWDEQRFAREYDLRTYMIVVTDDFNGGAMENKGLNIFNSRLVLADPASATDEDYFAIESVIGHEYFHNWTGNRITLRDWFQLSLKEGLTVFRDQEFSMDMSSRSVVRIDSVSELRKRQFAEDAGPNAHPIRPESCYAVDNFFTATIYDKGAEVIRMMQTIVGRPGFRKGMDLYFARHDGQAVTIEDFANCIAEANQQDWQQFQLWYSQAGTPVVSVSEAYEPQLGRYSLTLKQSCPATPEQKEKLPFHIPLAIGLLDRNAQELQLNCADVSLNSEGQNILHLKKTQQTFVFADIQEKPQLSLNRGFSAPIHLDWKMSEDQLIFLMRHDADEFNRWESAQKLALQQLQSLAKSSRQGEKGLVSETLIHAYQQILQSSLDPAIQAALLELPEDAYLLQYEQQLDVQAMSAAREWLQKSIAHGLRSALEKIYDQHHGKDLQSRDPKVFAIRRLKNLALKYLANLPGGVELAYEQFKSAQIMTDQQSAFSAICQIKNCEVANAFAEKVIAEFYAQWKDDNLVLNKWFALQAQSQLPNLFVRVQGLLQHEAFHLHNPNRVYSLILNYGQNLTQFHQPDLPTYEWLGEQILKIDQINPQVAPRLMGIFAPWTRLPDLQKVRARKVFQELSQAALSKNTFEIVKKTLAAGDLAKT